MQIFKQGKNGKYDDIPLITGGESGETTRKRNLTPLRVMQEENQNNNFSENPTFFSAVANVSFISQKNMYYTACPGCRKKVITDPSNDSKFFLVSDLLIT